MKAVTLAMVVLIALSCTAAWAGNPADADLFFRLSKAECIKYSDDVNSQSVFVTKPLSKNTSVMFYDWHTEGKSLEEYGLTVRATKTTQVGIVVDDWKDSGNNVSLLVDKTRKSTGIVCLIPTKNPEKAIVGLRQKIGNDLTAYGKFCQGSKPLLGVSYSNKKITVDVAYGSDTTHLRASKSFGDYTPELRMRFTPAENFYGWAIAKKF